MHPDEEMKLDAYVEHATAADRFADALHPEGARPTLHQIREQVRGENVAKLVAHMEKEIASATGLYAAMLGKP